MTGPRHPGRTLYHPAFAIAVEVCGPPGLVVQAEVALSTEPQRADLLLLRRRRDDGAGARIFRGLWRHLPRRVVVELRTEANEPRRGDWLRLAGYAIQYDVRWLSRLPHRKELGMLFVTPRWTSVLEHDRRRLGWTVEDLGGGYRRVHGAPFDAWLALLDEVAVAEQDPVAALFARAAVGQSVKGPLPDDVRWGLGQYLETMEVNMLDMEEAKRLSEEFIRRLPPERRFEGVTDEDMAYLPVDKRLAGLPPEARLAGLPPEARLAGLPPEAVVAALPPEALAAALPPEARLAGLEVPQSVLALPIEILRVLPQSFVDGLPDDVRDTVRRRLRNHR